MNETTQAIYDWIANDINARNRIKLYCTLNDTYYSNRLYITLVEQAIESYFVSKMLTTSYALFAFYASVRRHIDWRYIANRIAYCDWMWIDMRIELQSNWVRYAYQLNRKCVWYGIRNDMQLDANCVQIRRANRMRYEVQIVFDSFVFDFKFQNALTTFDFEIAICTYVLCDFCCACGVCVEMTITRCVIAISCSDRVWYAPIAATNGRLFERIARWIAPFIATAGGFVRIGAYTPMLYRSDRCYLTQ